MGFDSYCFICGGQAQIADAIRHYYRISAKRGTIPPVDSAKVKRFLLDKQDRAFLQDLVSIGPYDADDKPIIDHLKIYVGVRNADEIEAARLATIEPETIRMIEGLVPGSLHDLGALERPKRDGNFNVNAAVYPFGHALCFKLLAAFAPRLMQPVGKFWATVRAVNGTSYTNRIEGLDYGDVAGSQEQFVWPFHMYGFVDQHDDSADNDEDLKDVEDGDDDGDDSHNNGDEDEDDQRDWEPMDWEQEQLPKKIKAALRKEPLDSVDLHDYWLKTGRMYVWVRPDKFPVREAFQEPLRLISWEERTKPSANNLADLPTDVLLIIAQDLSLPEVLLFLGMSTSLRAKLASCVVTIARQHLNWAVPAAVGEQERWDALLKEAKGSSQRFPWLSYARQCYLSPSMRNRQRIWGICQQLERLALSHGVL